MEEQQNVLSQQDLSNVPTNLDVAYLAGLFDGEGCIICRPRQKLRTGNRLIAYHIEISMTDLSPLEWAQALFGGCLYHFKAKKEHWTDSHRWVLSQKQAAGVLLLMLPYLKVKKQEALLIFELAEIKAQYKRGHSHNFERQYEIVNEIRRLKGNASRGNIVAFEPPNQVEPKAGRNSLGQFVKRIAA